LIDPRYEERAKEVASVVSAEGGAEAAADALERLIYDRAQYAALS
jgi:hypothetical protein